MEGLQQEDHWKIPWGEVDANSEAISIALSVRILSDRMARHTPGSIIEAWMKDDTQTKKMYAKMIGTAGERLYQKYGALRSCQFISFDTDFRAHSHKRKEQYRRHNNEDTCDYVDWTIASILKPSSPAEHSIARKVFVVLPRKHV